MGDKTISILDHCVKVWSNRKKKYTNLFRQGYLVKMSYLFGFYLCHKIFDKFRVLVARKVLIKFSDELNRKKNLVV